MGGQKMNWIDSAIREIKVMKISHNSWEIAKKETSAAIFASSPGEVVSIVGPSRVGKSKLINELRVLLVGDTDRHETGTMPTVELLATNCIFNGHFGTKDFIIRALEKIEHPFYGVNKPDDPFGIDRYKYLSRTSEGILRPALEKSLEHRKTMYLFIDEIQHILRIIGGKNAAASFLDSLKCLAQEKDLVLILVGAYPLLDVLNLSPHLLGREQPIHFPRYYATNEGYSSFCEILETYSSVIRFQNDISTLVEWSELLYDGSLGCIGLLNNWLRSALGRAKANDDEVLKKEHFLKTMRPKKKLSTLAKEIETGEAALEADTGKFALEVPEVISITHDSEKEDIKAKSKTKKKAKPFQKNPRRYKIEGRQ